MNKLFKTLTLSLILATMLSISTLAANIGGGTISASALNLRSQPSTASSIVALVPKNSVVIIEEKIDEGWYAVTYNGVRGYMASEYISFEETLNADFGTGIIKGDAIQLRVAASVESPTLSYHKDGTAVTITGVSGAWYKVLIDGIAGYVHSDYIILKSNGIDSATSIGQSIVDTAQNYLGTPYVWAGSSPRGFDCSGFVKYVFNEYGYTLNRTAASMYEQGTYVDKSNLQVGDAVFFSSSSSGIGHVGIFIGNGQFIHSSSGSGCVVISDINAQYYVNRYVGARRFAS